MSEEKAPDFDAVKLCSVDDCENPAAPKKPGPGRAPTKCEEHMESRGNSKSTKSNSAPRSTSGVAQAVEAIDNVYSGLAMILLMVGAEEAASDLAASQPGIKAQNAALLAADPKLVKSINKVAASTGRAGFVIANGLVLGPVVATAAREIAAKRAAVMREDREPVPDDAWMPGMPLAEEPPSEQS